jgi:hypothetical protein
MSAADSSSVRPRAQEILDAAAASFEPGLAGARTDEPVLVRTPAGEPAYWLVPAVRGGDLVGAVRISLEGDLITVGRLEPARSGLVVTGITAAEAANAARATMGESASGVAAPPVFVADGPPGREGWLVEIRGPGDARRRLVIGRGGTYELGE